MRKANTHILHISYDIGEYNKTDKTTAVSNLIRETGRFSQVSVISLNRTKFPKQESTELVKAGIIKINSFGFPFGILHRMNLNRAYTKIMKASAEDLLKLKDLTLVHSHKLTFEGYIGYLISRRLGIPLYLTLRQTDFDVLRYRPDLRNIYAEILKHSSRIFYLVPIMLKLLKKRFGIEYYRKNIESKLSYLPNIVQVNSAALETKLKKDAPLITILRLTKRSVKRKNIKKLIKAAGAIKDRAFELQIIGGGNYIDRVQEWIRKYDATGKVKLIGEVPHEKIDQYYACAKAFVLPSFSESFGLVYAESLLNGTPILYSKDVIGFDGVFEGVGPAVNPNSTESIKTGLVDVLVNNDYYRENIIKLRANNEFRIFSPDYAAEIYYKALCDNFSKTNDNLANVPRQNSKL